MCLNSLIQDVRSIDELNEGYTSANTHTHQIVLRHISFGIVFRHFTCQRAIIKQFLAAVDHRGQLFPQISSIAL